VVAVAVPLLMAISIRAAQPPTMTNFNTMGATASGGGPCSPADCGCCTADAATSCSAADCGSCTAEAATNCCPVDCGCGHLRFCTTCGFVGGAEVAFLKPSFNNNVALVSGTTTFPTDGVGQGVGQVVIETNTSTSSATDFTSDYQASPRVWLGYVNSGGFGARVRYWQYDQSMSQFGTVTPNGNGGTNSIYAPTYVGLGSSSVGSSIPGDAVSASQHLHMYTVDAEITQWMQLGLWDITFGGGLRDAGVYIDRVNTFIPGPNSEDTSYSRTLSNHFDGLGPTVFTEFRRPFGDHGLAFVGKVRGSLLYGSKSLATTLTNETETDTYTQTAQGCLGVAEISLGMEWSREVFSDTTLFVRSTWENQYWANTGNSVGTTDSLGLNGFTLAVGLVH